MNKVYLVVVVDQAVLEARAQTVGVFGTYPEATDYADSLNKDWPENQTDRALVREWTLGHVDM